MKNWTTFNEELKNIIDITDNIISEIDVSQTHQEFEFIINNIIFIVNITIDDDRRFKDPTWDSSDGLPTLISGDITHSIEVKTYNEDDGAEIDCNYKFDEATIQEFIEVS